MPLLDQRAGLVEERNGSVTTQRAVSNVKDAAAMDGIGMIWPQHPLSGDQGLLVMPDGLRDAPKVIVTTGQIVTAVEGLRVFLSQHALPDSQGLIVEQNSVLYAPHVI